MFGKKKILNLKSDSNLPKKVLLFASMIALQKDEKWFLFHVKSSFCSQDN